MSQAPDTTTIEEPIRSMEADGFLITERVHSPNWVLARHDHAATIIGIILQGSYIETIGRRSRECGPYSVQLLPAGEVHAYRFEQSNVRCLTIEIKPRRLQEIRQVSPVIDRPAHITQGPMSALVARLYKEFRLMDDTSVLTVEGLILEALGEVLHHGHEHPSLKPPQWLRLAKDLIEENATRGVSLISVAASAGVHPSHLARSFRKFYRCSVGDHVRRMRLEYAIHELKTSERPLAEIASTAGFYDQSHMTHAFKAVMNMTPAEFRASVRPGHSGTKRL